MFGYTLATLIILGLAAGVWAVCVERKLLGVRRLSLPCEDLRLPPLKILHVTDTHFQGRDEWLLRFFRRLAAEETFDLVLLTGDVIDNARGLDSAAELAALFTPRIGGFAVLGGHDYIEFGMVRSYLRLIVRSRLPQPLPGGTAEELTRRLEAGGMTVLRDSHVQVDAPDGTPFALVGLRDACVFELDVAGAWRDIPADMPVMVIAHSPDALAGVSARNASLAFFGHTHGGQVRLPWLGAVITHTKLGRRFARGLFRCGETVFSVSSGAGTCRWMPARFLCRPEVTVATLEPRGRGRAFTPVEECRLD